MRKQVIVFAALAAACLGSFGQSGGSCRWCDRTVAVKAISLTNPWFTDEVVVSWLAPILSSSCVSVKAFGGEPKPEYILVVRFESNIHGKFPNLDGTYSDPGEVRGTGSIMTIVLFGAFGKKEPWNEFGAFGRGVPDYGCFLESARTEDKGFSWEPHKSLMLAQLGKIIPLEKYLRDWENTPVKVQIQPQQEDLDPGQEIKIPVTGFRDKSGKPMNTICNPNRVLFKAEKGEILNSDLGLRTVEDPRLMPFPISIIAWEDKYVIEYKAPEGRCSEDTIRIYNSCDVLHPDSLPWEQTRKKDLIGEKKLRIGCYRWDLTITSSSEKRYRHNYFKKNNVQGGQTIRHTDDEVISARITLMLVFDHSLDVPNEGQRWEYYHAESRDLSYFSATSSSERYNLSDYGDTGAETTHTVHKTPSDSKFDSPFLDDAVILVFDRKSGKALKTTIPLYTIAYTWNVEDKLQTVQWSPSKGRKVDRKESPRKDSEQYFMKAVEDKIQDPTVTLGGTRAYVEELFRKRGLTPPADIPIKEEKTKVAKINPDFLVKGGDGKTSFSGEGRKTTFTPTPNGSRREEKIFRWELKRSKK